MTQVTINGIKRGSLNADMTYHYVEQVKAYGGTIICWTDSALVIETGA